MLFGYAIGLSQFELFLWGSTFSTSDILTNPSERVDPPMINNFHVSVTIELVVSMVVFAAVGMVVSMVVVAAVGIVVSIIVAVDCQHSKKNQRRRKKYFRK